MGDINKPIINFKIIRFVTEMYNLFAMKAHNIRTWFSLKYKGKIPYRNYIWTEICWLKWNYLDEKRGTQTYYIEVQVYVKPLRQ